MTDLERINKVINDLFDIMDTARSNFGEEGYNALDKARQAVTDAWNVCKKGQERKGITNSRKPIKSGLDMTDHKDFRLISPWQKDDPMVGKDLTEKELTDYILDNDEFFDAVGLDYSVVYLPTGEEMSLAEYDIRYITPKRRTVKSSHKPIKSSVGTYNYDFFYDNLKDNSAFEEYSVRFDDDPGEDNIHSKNDIIALKMVRPDGKVYIQPRGNSLQFWHGGWRFSVGDNYGYNVKYSEIENATITDNKLVIDISDGTHLEFGLDGAITNSRKPIKSSLEDRLIPYLEEFEEGYADTINRDAQEGSNGAYEEAFIEGFKNDYNLTNEDIEKLRESVHEIWNTSSEEGEVRDMGEMYGVPRGASPEEALKHFE